MDRLPRRRGGFESAAGKTGRRDGRVAAASGTDVEKSRELKKALLAESKGKGRGAKSESARPASADAKSAKHRKGPPKSGAPAAGGGPRKRKAKS